MKLDNKITPKIKISKLDAARRQVETVIRLYFHNGDPVSIHTLTAAAYNILRDLNKSRGGSPMILKEGIFEQLKPEYHKEILGKINEAENFFKHADKDPDASLDFSPGQSELLIFEACEKYFQLTGEQVALFQIYRGWYLANNVELFKFEDDMKNTIAENALLAAEMSRLEYFNHCLTLVMQAW
ncbi:MAG: hypothetical protein ACAH07_06100 [Methylophilaceae bacterium]|nr:hypothetical protein [Methyloradius sp.]